MTERQEAPAQDAKGTADPLRRRKPQLRTNGTGARSNTSKPKAAAHSRLLSLATAEREYGISRWTWRDLIARGHIAAIRPPGLRRVFLDRCDIEAKLQEWKEIAQ